MTVEAAIFSRLSGFAGLTALVSTRIYPQTIPQNCPMPAVSYRRVSSQRDSAMGADIGLVDARFQFDVWASTYLSAREVTEALRGALQRWRNTSGTEVCDSFMLTEVDLYESETNTHHVAVDFNIIYRE